LADKIREKAGTDVLGSTFLGYEFNKPDLNVRGPQSVDFNFVEPTDLSRAAETQRLVLIVQAYM